jgi:hypothetical protein
LLPFFFSVTVPLGIPENCGATVIVKITVPPTVEGFADEVTLELVAALSTISATTVDELPVTFASPL